jgi:hypothetical protein
MRGRRSAVCTHSSGTKLGRRGLSQYRFVSAHASPSPRRLEPAQPEVFALTVFRRDLVSQDISIRSRSPCPAIIFISEPDHPRSRTRSAKCSRMPPQHCSMPSGLPSNWCEATNRQVHDHRSRGRSAAFRSSVIRTGQLRRQPVTRRPTSPDANSLPCRNGGRIRAKSVAILYPANVPTPPVPEAFASDVTSRPEIDGFVRVSLIIGPWGSKRSAKDGPCRQSADNRRDRKAMTPSSVRRR